MRKNLLSIFSIALIFNGCTNTHYANVSIDTFPKGGHIYDLEKNKLLGISHASGKVLVGKTEGDDQPKTICRTGKGFIVKWMSGATKQVDEVTLCSNENKTFTIDRPTDAQNLQADLEYARDLEYKELEERKIAEMKRQASAAEDAARAAEDSARKQSQPKFYNVTPNYMGGYNIMRY